MQLEQILGAAVRGGASDVILRTGALPHFRYQGQLVPLTNGAKLTQDGIMGWLVQICPGASEKIEKGDIDFAYQSRSGHRFRVNVFKQRGEVAMVLRVVLGHIRTLEELQLPSVVAKIAEEKRGLILVTGATGSGKSTTMAALLDRINRMTASHIVTIEDPIEYILTDQKSLIEQREVGIDTESFALAIKSALRQNPDVIMIGELRDEKTVRTALQAAETGHLVITTLHTSDASESIHRILGMFDAESQPMIQKTVAQVLRAVLSQRLVTRRDQVGMVAVLEILIGTSLVRDVIEKGDFGRLRGIIKEGKEKWGMQTFDQALVDLCQRKLITRDVALKNSSSESEVELMLSGIST